MCAGINKINKIIIPDAAIFLVLANISPMTNIISSNPLTMFIKAGKGKYTGMIG